MFVPRCSDTIMLNDINTKISEVDILSHYLGITTIPIVIKSPLRRDNNPSFGIYTPDGIHVRYCDFATRDSGGLYDLLMNLWGVSFKECINRIYNNLIIKTHNNRITNISISNTFCEKSCQKSSQVMVECKIREWRIYDKEYWESYGVSLELLKRAKVYPISHKIIKKNGKKYVFGADKYAYVYIEKKEGKIYKKIYQPYNKNGYKWCTDIDSSVIGLWNMLPNKGDKICICSSLKDSLCLTNNLHINTIYIQGEGYNMSSTAVNELRKRFKHIFICLDNDEAGIFNAKRLANQYNFINVVLPHFNGAKDISDFYKVNGKQEFLKLESLFQTDNLPY